MKVSSNYKCDICGKEYTLTYMDRNQGLNGSICQECYFKKQNEKQEKDECMCGITGDNCIDNKLNCKDCKITKGEKVKTNLYALKSKIMSMSAEDIKYGVIEIYKKDRGMKFWIECDENCVWDNEGKEANEIWWLNQPYQQEEKKYLVYRIDSQKLDWYLATDTGLLNGKKENGKRWTLQEAIDKRDELNKKSPLENWQIEEAK